jgi:nucleotide-binding universal stress UspA family protein
MVTYMTTLAAPERTATRLRRFALSGIDAPWARRSDRDPGAPIVVAVDGSAAARAAVEDGVRIARELEAPVVFVYVRRGPSATLGEPYHQRRLDGEIAAGTRAIDDALAVAKRADVSASGEQLHGNPARRVAEFARLRGARLLVLGSRRRRLGRSVSRAVLRLTDRPVLVAGRKRYAPA